MVRTNEDCLKIRELFSPALDQEIAPEEQTQLEKHLEECPVCRREWSDWLELSAGLQDLEWDCLPPPNFSQQVMQKIHQQVPRHSKNRINRWKALGGIAAALALAVGTVTWVDHLNSVPPTVAVGEPQPQVTSTLDNPKLTPETLTLEVPPVVQPEIPQETPIAATPDKPDKPSAESPNEQENPSPDPGNEPGSTPNNDSSVNQNTESDNSIVETQVAQEDTPIQNVSQPVVFLNKSEIKIDNTLLKLKAADIGATASQVSNLAAGYGVQASTASNSAAVQTVTLTVEQSQSPALIAGLSGLATVVSTSTETTDLTYRYKEAISRYQELQNLADNGNTEQQVESETLKQQIQNWEAQDGKTVITVWIEKMH